jgi:hypothetical protein
LERRTGEVALRGSAAAARRDEKDEREAAEDAGITSHDLGTIS